METTTRDYLVNLYLDWWNNYLSVTAFAEHKGLTYEQARILVDLGWDVYKSKHPDA